MDRAYVVRPLLDLIGRSEGTDRGRSYNETLAFGRLTGGPVELVSMTLDDIDSLQSAMLHHPGNLWNSSACGRYQIVRTTLRDLRRRLALSGRQRFDPAMQDRLAGHLLDRRGMGEYLAGVMGEDKLIEALAREWASLPTLSGKSYYQGQKTGVNLREVRAALATCRLLASQGMPRSAGSQSLATFLNMLSRLCRHVRNLLRKWAWASGNSGQRPEGT